MKMTVKKKQIEECLSNIPFSRNKLFRIISKLRL